MTEFEQNMNHEIDIANWEDEGGALKPEVFGPKKRTNVLLVCLGLFVALPLIYLLAKER